MEWWCGVYEDIRDVEGFVQETDGEDGQDTYLALCGDFELRDEVEGEEEDGPVGDYVDGGGGDEGGQKVDAASFDGGIPDAVTRHALEDGGTEVGEVEGEIGPDEDEDEIVGFTRAGCVEEAPIHQQDGEFGEEDGWAVKHFRGVC